MKKLILYPICITAVIILVILCDWLITAVLALVFQTSIANIALSPIILLYIGSAVGALYLSVSCCQYIDENL